MSKDKELNDKNKETKDLFANLKQYKKNDTNSTSEKIEDPKLKDKSEDINIGDSGSIYMSLLEDNDTKEEYIGATHYFRRDQLKDLDKFSKQTNKLKNEFMRELMDLVFAELKKGLSENKGKNVVATKTAKKNKTVNKTSSYDSPFGPLLEVHDTKDEYVRATHYFRQDQLNDLDRFVKKSGKSKNEFVRDTIDLVFSELKTML